MIYVYDFPSELGDMSVLFMMLKNTVWRRYIVICTLKGKNMRKNGVGFLIIQEIVSLYSFAVHSVIIFVVTVLCSIQQGSSCFQS